MTRTAPRYSLFIAHFATDVAAKSGQTRSTFSRVLGRSILAALPRAELRARHVQRHGHIFVLANDGERARAQLGRVFGIGTFSPVDARRPAELNAIAATAETHFAEVMQQFGYQAYALRARRSRSMRSDPTPAPAGGRNPGSPESLPVQETDTLRRSGIARARESRR